MSLQLHAIYKSYGEKQVLSGIDIEVAKGDFLALLGPSGCGKTTLLQAIAGLTPIDRGTITIDGMPVSGEGWELPTEKRNIGMVFQDFALWPHMNVFDNVAFGLKLQGVRGAELKKRVLETLDIFHMATYVSRYPHELSGGQKQRIAMARAMAPEPRLILMDEPLSSLDASLRDEMRIELVRITKQLGMTVVYVTHDQMEAMSMADQIVILRDGRCEQKGTPEQLYQEPVSSYVAKFMGAANMLNNLENSGYRFIRPEDVVIIEGEKVPQGMEVLSGHILFGSYQGQRYRYFAKVGEQEQLIEFTHPNKLGAGERVLLGLPLQRCREIQMI